MSVARSDPSDITKSRHGLAKRNRKKVEKTLKYGVLWIERSNRRGGQQSHWLSISILKFLFASRRSDGSSGRATKSEVRGSNPSPSQVNFLLLLSVHPGLNG
ncbi:hypothetical protein PoB_006018900 [Plakobranchus ocellatus]|uniref:Uncharacterized protein n=1 Tax=Plakobranchus ocellatus TaxID=259542 RepID=A0AAV4CPB0_9GAST|nr:hypothetical protein PoB_006018900 [Plakobranchus ocellatus]